MIFAGNDCDTSLITKCDSLDSSLPTAIPHQLACNLPDILLSLVFYILLLLNPSYKGVPSLISHKHEFLVPTKPDRNRPPVHLTASYLKTKGNEK